MILEHDNDIINLDLVRRIYINKERDELTVFFSENDYRVLDFKSLKDLEYCIATLRQKMSK